MYYKFRENFESTEEVKWVELVKWSGISLVVVIVVFLLINYLIKQNSIKQKFGFRFY